MSNEGKLAAWLLRKLMRSQCWGSKYQNKDDILRNLKNDGKSRRLVDKKIIPNLLNDGLLIQHKKNTVLSLNAHMKNEILWIIEKYYPLEE